MIYLTKSYLKTLLSTMLLSMLPVVELRGGIPYGMAQGLGPWAAFAAAAVGNLLPVPGIILLSRQIMNALRTLPRLAEKIDHLERRAHLKGRLVRKYRLFGLMLLVAIPLPGTGAWTGALVAALLDIRLRGALPAIAAGVGVAGMVILCLTYGVLSIVA